jgi:hypothetical protein
MKGCDPNDLIYFTFWPIMAFSFLVATDSILRDDLSSSNAVVFGLVSACKSFVHMFSISCLIISLLETYIAFHVMRSESCKRSLFLELDALLAASFFLILTFLNSIHGLFSFDEFVLSRVNESVIQLVSWCLSFFILLYQLYRILTNTEIIVLKNNRFVISIVAS